MTTIKRRPSFGSLFALLGMMGLSSGAPMQATTMTLKPSPGGVYHEPRSPRARSRKIGRVAVNQRQVRKDRRRAHAAGARHAFA